MFCKYLQNSPYSSGMLFYGLGKDQYIVQVYHHNSLCYQVIEDDIHHSLEGGWAVSHTKKHH